MGVKTFGLAERSLPLSPWLRVVPLPRTLSKFYDISSNRSRDIGLKVKLSLLILSAMEKLSLVF